MLVEEDLSLLDIYYNTYRYFSYSAIKLLLYSPVAYKNKYILKEDEEETVSKYLIKGKLTHCLLLNPHELNNQFIITPNKVPEGNSKLIVDRIFKEGQALPEKSLEDFGADILYILQEINLHQKLTTDEQRIKKVCTEDNKAYYEFLKQSKGKALVAEAVHKECAEVAKILSSDPKLRELLHTDVDPFQSEILVFNEFEIKMENTKLGFGFKGILDNFSINKTEKVVRIVDLKCSDRGLEEFPETLEYYKYWIQGLLYSELVAYYCKQLGIDLTGYTFELYFLVVDEYRNYYPFPVSKETMQEWKDRFALEVIPALQYHYYSKDFTLPYKLAMGAITL